MMGFSFGRTGAPSLQPLVPNITNHQDGPHVGASQFFGDPALYYRRRLSRSFRNYRNTFYHTTSNIAASSNLTRCGGVVPLTALCRRCFDAFGFVVQYVVGFVPLKPGKESAGDVLVHVRTYVGCVLRAERAPGIARCRSITTLVIITAVVSSKA